jgi:hypothetical protein
MRASLPCSSAALLHPSTLVALALWALNDHLLKGWGPALLTGKLSDVAGLVVCPVVLLGLLEWCAPRGVRRHLGAALAASCGATGLLLIGLELSPPVQLAYRQVVGGAWFGAQQLSAWLGGGTAPRFVLAGNTPDVTDLLALPALAVPWWLVRSGARAAREPDTTA